MADNPYIVNRAISWMNSWMTSMLGGSGLAKRNKRKKQGKTKAKRPVQPSPVRVEGLRVIAVENIPYAARVFGALRSLGYNLNSAVADIVDNSISADANTIWVDFWRSNNCFHLTITDDGWGMSEDKLYEAMRLGAEGDYRANSLGKFGMGLKTASLSQCRRLTACSRPRGTTDLCGFSWDIDFIEKTNQWNMLRILPEDIRSDARFKNLLNHSGTVVTWDDMDRLNNNLAAYKLAAAADNYVGRVIRELRLFLMMTFHRFLDGSLPDRAVRIVFNQEELSPWDPFCRKEPNTRTLEPVGIPIGDPSAGGKVLVEPFILPLKEGEGGFSSLDAWEDAKGLLSWNDGQGYYVYRADRLIHYGGWLRTRAKDEHTKYARVAISFDPALDHFFDISVHKTQIRLPASLFDSLKTRINPKVVDAAQVPYRTRREKSKPGLGFGGVPPTPAAPNKRSKVVEKKNITHPDKYITSIEGAPNKGFNSASKKAPGANVRKFRVEMGDVDHGRLWHLSCRPDSEYVVVLNRKCTDFSAACNGCNENPSLAIFLKAVLFALAYTELHSVSAGASKTFEEIQDVISGILDESIKEGVCPDGKDRNGYQHYCALPQDQ